eukprot:6212150-Pleurochrysis_carterae.AAC.1
MQQAAGVAISQKPAREEKIQIQRVASPTDESSTARASLRNCKAKAGRFGRYGIWRRWSAPSRGQTKRCVSAIPHSARAHHYMQNR